MWTVEFAAEFEPELLALAAEVAFAFDPRRRAILLVAGDKSGHSAKKFYKRLIATADKRFDAHLARIGVRRV